MCALTCVCVCVREDVWVRMGLLEEQLGAVLVHEEGLGDERRQEGTQPVAEVQGLWQRRGHTSAVAYMDAAQYT